MPKRHDIRRLAMQLLYEIDQRGEEDLSLIHSLLPEMVNEKKLIEPGWTLATGAWTDRNEADGYVAELAPDWPTGRQPPVDRAIMRLAYHEMRRGYAPTPVVIDEAVSLAAEFSSENSPGFINGVLEQVGAKLREAGLMGEVEPHESTKSEKAWLEDALRSSPGE